MWFLFSFYKKEILSVIGMVFPFALAVLIMTLVNTFGIQDIIYPALFFVFAIMCVVFVIVLGIQDIFYQIRRDNDEFDKY